MSLSRRFVLIIAIGTVVATISATGVGAQTDEPLVDPLPDPVVSGVGLTVEEFATFPQSEPVPPPTDPRLMRRARINYLGELPDGSGRLYVPDLNGMLYLLDDGGEPQP